MSDLIKRQNAIDALSENIEDCFVLNDAIKAIQGVPSVQRKGKWKTTYLDHEAMGERPRILYCSECNQCIAYPTNFCPNCGADMRGEDDEIN